MNSRLDREQFKPGGLLVLFFAVGVAVRLWLAWQPVTTLVARFNADDAYYYLTIARNLALGNGASFDGLAPTNGFHPLYLLLIVPLFWNVPHTPELVIHLALSLLAVLNALTALPLYTLLRRLAGKPAAVFGAAAWLFNPWIILITLEGVETGLASLLVALSAEYYVRLRAGHSGPNERDDWIRLGVLMALAILARTDAVLLVFAVMADWFMLQRGNQPGLGPTGERIRSMARAVGASGIVLLPWLAWNWMTFGTVIQVSGAAIFYRTHPAGISDWRGLIYSPLGYWVTMTWSLIWINFQVLVLGVASLLLKGLATIRRKNGPIRAHRGPSWSSVHFLMIYAALLFLFYGGYLLHMQLWYLVPVSFVVTVVGAIGYSLMRSGGDGQREGGFALVNCLVLIVLCAGFLMVWESLDAGLYPAQYDGYRIAQWLEKETEKGARIGAWNSGIIGFFSERAVVNLDGVVNNRRYSYVVSRRAALELLDPEYVAGDRIDYITDYEDVFDSTKLEKWDGRMTPVYEFSSWNGTRLVRIYRVVAPGPIQSSTDRKP